MKLPKIYHTWILKIVPFTALYRVKLFVLIIATSHFWSLTVSLRESNAIYDNWFRTMTLFTTLWYTSVLDSKTQTQRHLLYSLTIKPYTLPWSHVLFNLRDYIWLILSHVVVPIQGGCNIYPQIQAPCVLNPNWFVSGYLCNSTGVHSISQYCSWNRKGIVPGEERNLLSLNLNTYAFYTCSYPRKTQTFGFYRIYRDSNVSKTFVSRTMYQQSPKRSSFSWVWYWIYDWYDALKWYSVNLFHLRSWPVVLKAFIVNLIKIHFN